MSECERIRDVLPRAAEGEARPEESLLLARHLSGCTACRILLARERRLQDVLSGIKDPIEVESTFLERVMAALPATPPQAASKPARRRGLKLAVFAGLAGTLGLAAAAWGGAATPWSFDSFLPAFSPEVPDRWIAVAAALGRLTATALAQIGIDPESTLRVTWWPWHRSFALAAGTGAAALLLLAAVAAARTRPRMRGASTEAEVPQARS